MEKDKRLMELPDGSDWLRGKLGLVLMDRAMLCKSLIQFSEQYCIRTWNVRSMNQRKLEAVKQEMAIVNIDILGISELKCFH